ncbi:Bax inhibitor-1/YccA family protein [Vallitaleaceae bacterium 9-2]
MNDNTLTIQGLNAFLSKVFMWMFFGLMLTALTSLTVASSPLLLSLIFSNRLIFFGLLIGEFALVIVLSKNALKYSYGKTVGLFLFYSFLNGLTLSSILLLYTGQSIATAFMIASVVFGVMALYGYVTKTDLTPFRSFLMVGVIGIIVLTVINIFLGNGTLFYLINLAGVVIFAGLTAYDLQKMKSLYAYSVNNTQVASGNIAVTGALTLYLDFINLFLFILRLSGKQR